MNENSYDVIVAGAGLASLCAATRLCELGIKKIAVYAPSFGGTPYIAAINFVLPENPYGDTVEQYVADMLSAGYQLNDRTIVQRMCDSSAACYEFLKRMQVEFALNSDGTLKRRHASGSTFARSLCSTKELIGAELVRKLTAYLRKQGVALHLGSSIVSLCLNGADKKICGAVVKTEKGDCKRVSAPVVIAGWGGVGTLLGTSTYPADVNGRTLAVAAKAGAELRDLEFLEYEPMVVLSPAGAVGEPCPTAMLGEGAYLLNTERERFILKIRPEGEKGSPKTLLNKAIWQEAEAGRGTANGGVYADMRHINPDVLKAYPWFYNRLMENGVNPCKELVEVGPMAHSYSGGIGVDADCRSSVTGLYAVGEAAAGFHGACRMAGNAAAQAAVSGMRCAQAAAEDLARLRADWNACGEAADVNASVAAQNPAVRQKNEPVLKQAAKALGIYRNGKDLLAAQNALSAILAQGELQTDCETAERALSLLLMVSAALERKESRGTHLRTDYPETAHRAISNSFKQTAKGIELCK